MNFGNRHLQRLMQIPRTDPEESAKQANLCMEERISASRQADYEAAVGSPGGWGAWQGGHARYVQIEVRRRLPLSASFGSGEPSLRSDIDPNQYLYRVERIDDLLSAYEGEEPVGAAHVNEWIKARESNRSSGSPTGGIDNISALEALTDSFNDDRDGRPSFAVFAAEFPGLEKSSDWAKQMCKRCGLTHYFSGVGVTLALFRYSVQDVLDDSSWPGETLFAVPTVMDQPMSNVFFPAPRSAFGGYAVGLEPKPDCSHLAAELIHARMDYQAHHWMRVDTVNDPCPSTHEVRNLRKAHLSCIRRHSEAASYGVGCV